MDVHYDYNYFIFPIFYYSILMRKVMTKGLVISLQRSPAAVYFGLGWNIVMRELHGPIRVRTERCVCRHDNNDTDDHSRI